MAWEYVTSPWLIQDGGAEIYAGNDRLAVVSWTQASVIQNNLATIVV
ncbi:hypothetical protein [Limnofasciculus baicalensis]|uniref:Uncharacterized protein n=1 Tax=Limnofasciculus baicalensis BBK-W-15 TaxID=2699891 RepID=A0AAE3KMX4_9CYAN|nr:hypothetical protein [Limnofasciculus baicalensis]MCP2728053.1 hypothetical protein [Limnofasciculus baicalensis BBK-W-15]